MEPSHPAERVLPRLLVAEDDPDMRLLLCQVFRRDGFEVEQVEDGLQLSRYLERCTPCGELPRPDIVVSDVRMPGQTALEVLGALRGGNFVKFVLITAFGDARTHQEGLALGAAAVLDKPVDMDLLRATVRQIAGLNQAAGA